MTKKLRVDVWSDVACPWCYVGKRRLEAALAEFDHRADVEIVWRAFELDPSAPKENVSGLSYAERLAKKYGMSTAQAEERIAQLVGVAKADGLDFEVDRIRPGNTFDAHRVIHFAGEKGLQGEMKERLLRAYFSEGECVGDHATLARLAEEVGLSVDEVSGVLASDAEASEVRGDEDEAREVGIRGVPFFVFGGKYAVSGAQPSEVLLGALKRSWSELPDRPIALAEGAACGVDGCD